MGTIVDCMAAPESDGPERVIHAARRYLEKRGVDLIVTNQSHAAWRDALRAAGFLEGPSNFLYGASKALAALGVPAEEMHLNRGDGDGPVHLWSCSWPAAAMTSAKTRPVLIRMDHQYLLDTNTASYIIKGSRPALDQHLAKVPMARIAISAVTEDELRFGTAQLPHSVHPHRVLKEFFVRVAIQPWMRTQPDSSATCALPWSAKDSSWGTWT